MNQWDNKIPRLDVCDDYQSEKKEVLAAQGAQFHFTHGDYCVKLLLGSIDPDMDRLDERAKYEIALLPSVVHAYNPTPAIKSGGSGCCIIN